MLVPQFMTTYAANSYASQAYRLRQYSTVCRLMMIERRIVALDGPIIALLIIHTQQEATPQ
jgi:hypothetical protein